MHGSGNRNTASKTGRGLVLRSLSPTPAFTNKEYSREPVSPHLCCLSTLPANYSFLIPRSAFPLIFLNAFDFENERRLKDTKSLNFFWISKFLVGALKSHSTRLVTISTTENRCSPPLPTPLIALVILIVHGHSFGCSYSSLAHFQTRTWFHYFLAMNCVCHFLDNTTDGYWVMWIFLFQFSSSHKCLHPPSCQML